MFCTLLYDALYFVYNILFFAIPIALIALYGVSLYRYRSAKNQNKTAPGTFSDSEIKKRKTVLTVLSVMTGILVAVVIGFIALMYMAVAFM